MRYIKLFFFSCFFCMPLLPAAEPQAGLLLIPGLHISKLPGYGFYDLNGSFAEPNKGPVRVKIDLLAKYEKFEAATIPLIFKNTNRDSVLVSMGFSGRFLRLVRADVAGAEPVAHLSAAVVLWKDYLEGRSLGELPDHQQSDLCQLSDFATFLALRKSQGSRTQYSQDDNSDSWCSIS